MMTLNFYLKAPQQKNFPVHIYGSLPELGNGDPHHGILLTNNSTNSSYSLSAKISLSNNEFNDEFWYNYYFKTRFGSIVNESCTKRYFQFKYPEHTFYDTFSKPSSLDSVLLTFRVRYRTNFGQQLFLCGDSPELGKWKPEKSIPLEYTGGGDNWVTTISIPTSDKPRQLKYKYIVFTSPNNYFWEPEKNHIFEIGPTPSASVFQINDVYRWSDSLFEVYSLDPFIKVINRRQRTSQPFKFITNNTPDTIRVNFTVYAPNVRSNQILCIVGSNPEIGNWDAKHSCIMNDCTFPVWKAAVDFPSSRLPIEYKYVLLNKQSDEVIYEQGFNRQITRLDNEAIDFSFPISIVINDWFTNPNTEQYKGFGISTSIYTLRTERSCGVGQYTDLNVLVDYCKKVGSSLIHVLPVNDTSSCEDGDWEDSNPLNFISGESLHPIYIDLLAIPNIPQNLQDQIKMKMKEFEAIPHNTQGYFKNPMNSIEYNYPAVYSFKIQCLKQIYSGVDLNSDEKFHKFVEDNEQWLPNYSLFCYFRDKYKTKDFTKWTEYPNFISSRESKMIQAEHLEDLKFYYWVQYICFTQLLSAREYAENYGIVLEGEISLNTPYHSVSVWMNHNLFNTEMRAGNVPSSENLSSKASNCPSLDLKANAANGYEIWSNRIKQMSLFFHILQINNSDSVFRTWEVDHKKCIRNILGHFHPSIPITSSELKGLGLFDIERYSKPYLRWHLLKEKFGPDAEILSSVFFNHSGASLENQIFSFKEDFNDERKIIRAMNFIFENKEIKQKDVYKEMQNGLITGYSSRSPMEIQQILEPLLNSPQEKRRIWENGLIELLDNVLLVEDPYQMDCYHPRAQLCIEKVESNSIQNSDKEKKTYPNPSWDELPQEKKDKFKSIFTDFFYHRQNDLWHQLSAPKINAIKQASNSLLCSDDIQKDHDFSDYFYQNNILSSRVQRVPRYYGLPFDKVREFPYLSISTPATSVMSSIREWWEEDHEVIADFWRQEIWRTDEPPQNCEPWIQELIFKQYLASQSMWTVFMLQDVLSIDERYRPTDPKKERLIQKVDENQKGNKKWCRRMEYPIERLIEADDFCFRIRNLVSESHRI